MASPVHHWMGFLHPLRSACYLQTLRWCALRPESRITFTFTVIFTPGMQVGSLQLPPAYEAGCMVHTATICKERGMLAEAQRIMLVRVWAVWGV